MILILENLWLLQVKVHLELSKEVFKEEFLVDVGLNVRWQLIQKCHVII